MTANYYPHPNRNLPDEVQSHVESICIYIASLFFFEEFKQDPQKAFNRLIISDTSAGSNVALGDAIEWFGTMWNSFPFVVYNVGESLPADYGNIASTALSLQYVPELNAYVRAFPMDFEMTFIGFFNDSLDHRKAVKLIGGENAALTRLYTPMLIDDLEVNLPITLSYELSKGDLASELEQYLAKGPIWNMNFTIRARYYEYIVDELPTIGNVDLSDFSSIVKRPKRVAPVEDLILRFYQKAVKLKDSKLLDQISLPDPLTVVSTSPKNGDKDVSLGSEISIQFSKPVVPDTVVTSIRVIPDQDFEIYYNVDYTIVNLDPTAASGLAEGTEIQVLISKDLKDADNQNLEEDYEFKFKTVPNTN